MVEGWDFAGNVVGAIYSFILVLVANAGGIAEVGLPADADAAGTETWEGMTSATWSWKELTDMWMRCMPSESREPVRAGIRVDVFQGGNVVGEPLLIVGHSGRQ